MNLPSGFVPATAQDVVDDLVSLTHKYFFYVVETNRPEVTSFRRIFSAVKRSEEVIELELHEGNRKVNPEFVVFRVSPDGG